jgi:penicillin amidase
MALLLRWLVRLAAAVLALGLAVAGVALWFVTRSLVDPSAIWTVEGPTAPIEIVRDTHAVPHVFGETDADVYFGLGFAHAQDRLWQMTTARRTAQGRLSEVFGERTLHVDELMRRLDLAGLAAASLEVQDAETLAMLEAYAAGVNAWLGQVNAGALGRGAPENFVFDAPVAPWRPADSLAIAKLLGVQLASHVQSEVLAARLSMVLPEERLADLLEEAPGPGVAALPDYAAVVPGTRPVRTAEAPARDPLSPVSAPSLGGASNAWAADATRSAAGGTLLANDPHLALTAPSVWYLARLELASGGVVGATVPGIPVVLLGRSERLAWGMTSSYLDDQDVHVERLSPEDPSLYLTPDGPEPFRERTARIEVADGEAREIVLRWTENGPVLPGHHFDLASVTPEGHVASVAWTLLTPRDTSMTAGRRLMEAGSREEALEAARLHVAPSQNLVLADAEGIAMATIGAMPRRAPGHATEGRMPSPGWVERNRWRGAFDAGERPLFEDPEGGILGNTNNKVIERPFPRHVSHDWGDTVRVERWRRLMQAREVHTRESFVDAQLDTVSQAARTLLPLIGRELWYQEADAPEGTVERQRKRALDRLAEWNGEMSEHRPEPLLYAAWLRALQDRLVRDELGPLTDALSHPRPLFIERVFRDVDGASAWCDVALSAPVETCADIARLALDDALLWVGETHGTALESLRWGDVHQATHDHPALGGVPVLSWLVNIRQDTPGGDHTLLRGRTKGGATDPFLNVHAAGYRGVYDLADPDASVFVIATGQSGHPLSRHYDDMGDLWRRGEYVPMTLDPALARAGAAGITIVEPAG